MRQFGFDEVTESRFFSPCIHWMMFKRYNLVKELSTRVLQFHTHHAIRKKITCHIKKVLGVHCFCNILHQVKIYLAFTLRNSLYMSHPVNEMLIR